MTLRKRLVYLISWKFSDSDGVTRKTFEQLGEWAKSMDILLVWLQNDKDIPKLGNIRVPEGLEISFNLVRTNPKGYLKIINQVDDFAPDYIYTRYPFFHPLIFILLCKYPSLLEINTLEKKEMRINLTKKRSLAFTGIYQLVMITRDFFLRRAEAIFFVTQELMNHADYAGFPNRYFVPNSISSRHFQDLKRKNSQDSVNLLFIGTQGHAWHGIDKIELLARLTPQFQYHIVGARGESKGNITYYGQMDKSQIKMLMGSMNICIGSLSLNVLGLTQACPLKVREYIAAGFPVILGYQDAAFQSQPPEWVYEIDFEQLNVSDFVEFCMRNKDFAVSSADKNKYICLEKLEKERVMIIQGIDAKVSS